jgi:hypothetical protein
VLRIGERVGQARAIDAAYALVDTPYIFHLEDDWEFYRSGFIERSKLFMENDPSTLLAWLRAWDDTNRHPLSFRSPDGSMGVMARGFDTWWNGFTFNPALRRTRDYHRLGSFAQRKIPEYPWAEGGKYEAAASVFYGELGYRAVILDEKGYVRHIGADRHVEHAHG